MNRSKVLICLFSAAIAGFAARTSTGAEDHEAHHPQATTSQATAGAPAPTQAPSDVAANMKKMQEQMAAIRAAKDSKERAKLMDEHMQTMRTTMSSMEKNGGCMMGGMMKSGEGGMGMMQMMMDQMMQHQKAMQGTPK